MSIFDVLDWTLPDHSALPRVLSVLSTTMGGFHTWENVPRAEWQTALTWN